MTYVDCQADARLAFARLFEKRGEDLRQEHSEAATQAKAGRTIRIERRRETSAQLKRRKGWLHRQVRDAKR